MEKLIKYGKEIRFFEIKKKKNKNKNLSNNEVIICRKKQYALDSAGRKTKKSQ
jgi:hypothetical protein